MFIENLFARVYPTGVPIPDTQWLRGTILKRIIAFTLAAGVKDKFQLSKIIQVVQGVHPVQQY